MPSTSRGGDEPQSAHASRSAYSLVQPLVGRSSEIATLKETIARAISLGTGGSLMIVGEPGVGKSALLKQAARNGAEQGMLVLEATGGEAEVLMPFAGLQQLLNPISEDIANLPTSQREGLLAALGHGGAPPELYLVALAVLNLLTERASTQATLLVVDDVHWLDAPTNRVLAFVERRLECDPLVMFHSCRRGSEPALDRRGLATLQVGELDDDSARALLDTHASNLEPRVREHLLRVAAGNPLALVELPAAWSDQQWSDLASSWVPLTDKLRMTFSLRAELLPAATRTLLIVAALNYGGSIHETLAAGSIVLSQSLNVADLEPAATAGLLDLSTHEPKFRHPLMRAAIRQSTTVSERLAAHEALVQVLAHDTDRRIWHQADCAIGPDEEVAANLEATALRALNRRSTVSALTAMRRAAELSTERSACGRRLLQGAEIANDLGWHEVASDLLDRAAVQGLSGPEDRRMRWLRESIADARGVGTVWSSVALANQLNADRDHNLALRALLMAALKAYWSGADDDTRGPILEAVDALTGLRDHDPKVLAIWLVAAPYERGKLAIDRLSQTGPAAYADPEDNRLLGAALSSIHEYRLGATFLAASIDGLRAEGRLGLLARALQSYAWNLTWLGQWDEALHTAEEARDLAEESSQPRWAAASSVAAAQLLGNRGHFEQADTMVIEAEKILVPIGARPTLALATTAHSAIALAAGQHAVAYREANRLFDRSFTPYELLSAVRAITDLAEAAVPLGLIAECRAHLHRVSTLMAPLQVPFIDAQLHCAFALLAANDEDGDAHSLSESREWPFLRARLLLAQGRRMRRRRKSVDARKPLYDALDTFDLLGATPWSELAFQELRASGESARRRAPSSRHELTPQELQIARLAAQGMTNRDIGERLFLSPRTVGSHLYKIFPKLGITSRSQLMGHPDI